MGGDFYNWCFAGNDDEYGDFRYCPGVDTQASFWLLNGSGGFNKLMQASTYGIRAMRPKAGLAYRAEQQRYA